MKEMQKSEMIAQLLYRRLKKLPITVEEGLLLDDWLSKSPLNRMLYDNLRDDNWIKNARKRYSAPGKEEGLRQLRQQLGMDGVFETELEQRHRKAKRSFLIFVALFVIFLLWLVIDFFILPSHVI